MRETWRVLIGSMLKRKREEEQKEEVSKKLKTKDLISFPSLSIETAKKYSFKGIKLS